MAEDTARIIERLTDKELARYKAMVLDDFARGPITRAYLVASDPRDKDRRMVRVLIRAKVLLGPPRSA